MGWKNYFGFVCTPDHSTYQNIVRENVFSVTYPRPTQVIFASLAAAPRTDDSFKPSLTSLPTFKAGTIDGRFVSDGYAFLECRLHKIVNGFGRNSLITGEIIAAKVHQEALRISEVDDDKLMRRSPVLAYLEPGRFARIETSYSFPLPKDFSR